METKKRTQATDIAENPADEWIARNVNWATERQKELNAIAYLQPGE